MKVYAVAFRHVTPGEGVGGFEWDTSLEAARARIAEIGVFDDQNYETLEKEYEVSDDLTREEITDEIDGRLWDEEGR